MTDMTPEQALIKDLRDRLGRTVIEDDGAVEDNLAIALASYFDGHLDRPDDDPIDDELGWGKWVIEKSNKALELIARAALSRPAVPEGYKLVPVEPTDEMCEALEECLRDHGFDHDGIGELSKAACWDALLAAAPEPASVSLEKSEAYIRGVSAGLHVGEEIGRRKSAEGDSE